MSSPTPPSAIAVKRAKFLESYTMTGTITAAAKLAEIARDTHYGWLKQDPEYAALFAASVEEFADRIRLEIARRAIQGIKKDIYYQGVVVGQQAEYSDRMLELIAKAKCAEFKDSFSLEHTGEVTFRWLTPEEKA